MKKQILAASLLALAASAVVAPSFAADVASVGIPVTATVKTAVTINNSPSFNFNEIQPGTVSTAAAATKSGDLNFSTNIADSLTMTIKQGGNVGVSANPLAITLKGANDPVNNTLVADIGFTVYNAVTGSGNVSASTPIANIPALLTLNTPAGNSNLTLKTVLRDVPGTQAADSYSANDIIVTFASP